MRLHAGRLYFYWVSRLTCQERRTVHPDHVERGADGPVVRRLRTGRPPKKIEDDVCAL